MTFPQIFESIIKQGRIEGKSDEFVSFAITYWLYWSSDTRLLETGWLDDEDETFQEINDEGKGYDIFTERAREEFLKVNEHIQERNSI